jgi:hypothetical protein
MDRGGSSGYRVPCNGQPGLGLVPGQGGLAKVTPPTARLFPGRPYISAFFNLIDDRPSRLPYLTGAVRKHFSSQWWLLFLGSSHQTLVLSR